MMVMMLSFVLLVATSTALGTPLAFNWKQVRLMLLLLLQTLLMVAWQMAKQTAEISSKRRAGFANWSASASLQVEAMLEHRRTRYTELSVTLDAFRTEIEEESELFASDP